MRLDGGSCEGDGGRRRAGAEGGGAAPAPLAQPASLLELPTKLDTLADGFLWSFSVYVEAREAGGCCNRVSGRRRSGFRLPEPVRPAPSAGTDDPDIVARWEATLDAARVERAQRSRDEAARRARGQVRRYAATHGLNRLGTLTYRGDGCHDPREVRADLGRFFRQLRAELGVASFPYVWVPEWHPGGHGLHAHFAVGRFIGRRLIERSWPHGFVHIKLLGNLPTGSGRVAEARRVARYLGKYVSKDPAAGSGLHRYGVARGYQPRAVKVWGRAMPEAIAAASELIGAEPEYVWNSDGVEGWTRPPAGWVSWPG